MSRVSTRTKGISRFLGVLLVAVLLAWPLSEAEACPPEEDSCSTAGAYTSLSLQRSLVEAARSRAIGDSGPLIATQPEIWARLKDYVYKRLPHHKSAKFEAVWVGMSFETPDETIAALGLVGSWL